VVQSIDFINDKTGRLLVKLSIEKDFILPEKTVAEITTATLIAGMKIRLLFGEGEGAYKSGDTIPGRLATSVLAQFQDELVPLKNKMETMVTTLDSVLSGIGDVLTPEFKKNLRGSMANLNHATGSIDQMVSSRESGLKKMVEDLSVFSKMLAENSDKLSGTIGNLETITDTLAAADLYPTLINLKATLENTAVLIEGMNEGKGTTGKLFTDDSLYTNLNSSIRSLDILLQDIQAQPKRYVHFSLFGKKDKPTK
jgi:phospholipid/cholesterol/gamma-HCH transport system substrate-binding protein